MLQTPCYPRPFIVTDAAVNLAATLEQKADILAVPDLERGNMLAKQPIVLSD